MSSRISKFLAMSVLLASSSAAIADVFVEISGIPGDSVTTGYEGAIDAAGVSGNFAARSCGDILMLKSIDSASPLLIEAAVSQKPVAEATISYVVPGEETFTPLVIVLSNLTIASVSTKLVGDAGPTMEEVVLHAAGIDFVYSPQNDDGSAGSEISTMLDCGKSK